ncbi:MAG: VCBS repeat-containing protein [Hyphomicrobiales bacterium]
MKKNILRVLLLLGVALPLMVVGMSYMKAYTNPYGKEDLTGKVDVPVFQEVDFPVSHKFTKEFSLPFIGSSIIDVDGDNIPEVFIAGGHNQADSLLKFEGSGFVDTTSELGKGLTKPDNDTTYGASVIDVDNDGRSDIFIARASGVWLYLNKPGGFEGKNLNIKFNERSVPLSVALTDLNHDGFVDMYVATYLKPELVEGLNIFNKEGYGSNSIMLMNNGDNTFKDITVEAGLEYLHNTFLGVFSDVDKDGDQDLIVAHDTGKVLTWRNEGNLKFTSAKNPTSDQFGYPMGIAVGDYNNDSNIDFFFSNVSSTPPGFIVKGDLRDDQKFHKPLLLFKNNGGFNFTDAAEETNTANYEFSWGTVFDDLNNDGREDLLISQNFISLPLQKLFRLPGRVLLQKDDGTFATAEADMGLVNRTWEITSLIADFNNDGYRDIVKINLNDKQRAFISGGGNANFVKVRLPDTVKSLSAVVQLERGDGVVLTQQFTTGEGLLGDQSHDFIFGMGDVKQVKSLTVSYANGEKVSLPAPEVNTTVIVE